MLEVPSGTCQRRRYKEKNGQSTEIVRSLGPGSTPYRGLYSSVSLHFNCYFLGRDPVDDDLSPQIWSRGNLASVQKHANKPSFRSRWQSDSDQPCQCFSGWGIGIRNYITNGAQFEKVWWIKRIEIIRRELFQNCLKLKDTIYLLMRVCTFYWDQTVRALCLLQARTCEEFLENIKLILMDWQKKVSYFFLFLHTLNYNVWISTYISSKIWTAVPKFERPLKTTPQTLAS